MTALFVHKQGGLLIPYLYINRVAYNYLKGSYKLPCLCTGLFVHKQGSL